MKASISALPLVIIGLGCPDAFAATEIASYLYEIQQVTITGNITGISGFYDFPSADSCTGQCGTFEITIYQLTDPYGDWYLQVLGGPNGGLVPQNITEPIALSPTSGSVSGEAENTANGVNWIDIGYSRGAGVV